MRHIIRKYVRQCPDRQSSTDELVGGLFDIGKIHLVIRAVLVIHFTLIID